MVVRIMCDWMKDIFGREFVAVILVVLVECLLLSFFLSGGVIDDAYISFRYAVNLANGFGLTYNPGQLVEGYSNFLWVILLSAAAWLGLPLNLYSISVGLVCAVVSLWFAYLLGCEAALGNRMGGLVPCL